MIHCPKCGKEQKPSDACIGCGIVFAKYRQIQERRAQKAGSGGETSGKQEASGADAQEPSLPARWLLSLRALSQVPWHSVSTPAVVLLSAGFAIIMFLLASGDAMGGDSLLLSLLHNVNLVIHEAGHWIFAVFGNRTLAIFGGSLNQWLIPALFAGSFWARRDAVGFAFSLFWLFENAIDVAVYMADSRALVLPLLGGMGEEAHDWRNLFMRFGLLEQDTAIAAMVRAVGWLGMLGIWGWLLWRWRVDGKAPDSGSG